VWAGMNARVATPEWARQTPKVPEEDVPRKSPGNVERGCGAPVVRGRAKRAATAGTIRGGCRTYAVRACRRGSVGSRGYAAAEAVSAVVGSMMVLIISTRVAGKPPWRACSLTISSFGAM